MAKIKYDASKAESGGGNHAPVGTYHIKLKELNAKESSNTGDPMVEAVWQVTKDAKGKKLKENFMPIYTYAPLDPEASWAFRLRELTDALGLKPKGTLDSDKLVGSEVVARLKEDKDQNGDYRPRVAKLMRAEDESEEDEPEDDDEQDDEEEQDEPEAEEDDEAEDEEDDDEEEDDEDEDGVSRSDLDDLSRKELKAFIKENELDVTPKKSMSDDDLREAVATALGLDEEDDDEEADDEEADYSEWSADQLKNELKERGLSTSGSKAVKVKRLEKDDESADNGDDEEPF